MDPNPKKELTEVKIKTLEEIRAEKLARNQQLGVDDAKAKESSQDLQSGNKRTASQGNRLIRIKRPKLADEAPVSVITTSVTPKLESKPAAVQKTKSLAQPAVENPAPVPDSPAVQEGDEEFDEEVEAGEGQTGTMNDDELLLEIDNILGD